MFPAHQNGCAGHRPFFRVQGREQIQELTSSGMAETPVAAAASSALKLRKVAAWRGIRVLAWSGDVLYGCRGYQIVRLHVRPQIGESAEWEAVARFRPVWWRNLTSRSALSLSLDARRLSRAGHSRRSNKQPDDGGRGSGRARNPDSGSEEFHVTHQVQRGTRPLHVTAVPSGRIYWGEYFDNRERAEVHIYVSTDRGRSWQVAYTFPAGSIRHVHNIVYDRWGDCLWILTGDEGAECKVLRASCDLGSVEVGARREPASPGRGCDSNAKRVVSFHRHALREEPCSVGIDRAGNVEQVGRPRQFFHLRLPSGRGDVLFDDDRTQCCERRP